MKILFDYAAFTMQATGGVSRCMYDLFRHVSESKEDSVLLYAGIHRNRYLKNAPPELKKKIIGFYLPEPWFKQTLFMPFNRFCFQIFARFYRPDLCQFTYYDAPRTPAACKNVLTVYDMIHEKFPDYFSGNNPQIRWKRTAVREADAIICISENTRRDLESFIDLSDKTVAVIPIGSELHTVPTGPEALSVKEAFLLYVGNRNTRYKNFTVVLKAFAEIASSWPGKLLCFGGGPFTTDEIAMITELGLAERIDQRSGDDSLLMAAYRQAFALVYPSTYEGFGLPPVEAMSLGCPVLSSLSPPMPEILGDACLYFNPDSSKDLVRVFSEIQTLSVKETLVSKGKKQSEFYRWSAIAPRTRTFYSSAINL